VPLELTVVDAFAERPFGGNPAAVAVLGAFPSEAFMQQVASELNLSETAFVVARSDGGHDLRWFTPLVEVDLCGHATLAAAHVLGAPARFHTRSGLIECGRGPGGRIEMDLPADVAQRAPAPTLSHMPPVSFYGRGREDVLVVVEDPAALRRLEPDLNELARLGSRCVIVTGPGDRAGVDFVSRVFAPNAGIAEDPVTGSAHCTLATFWGDRLGKVDLVGEQASRRGGLVHMRRAGRRVRVGGHAVTVAATRILV